MLAGPVSFTHFFLRDPGNRRVPWCTFSTKHERVRRLLLKPFVFTQQTFNKHVSPTVSSFLCSQISVESADVSALGSRLSDAERRLDELHTQTSGESSTGVSYLQQEQLTSDLTFPDVHQPVCFIGVGWIQMLCPMIRSVRCNTITCVRVDWRACLSDTC